jgi:D-beta-D-heptose 7-phosphate kinase/D-beta-D-heptose 1-phosphate adenosyltransferase
MAKKKLNHKINATKQIVVAVSGGFDPIHPGHIRLIHEAKKLGTKLVVILNNDNWLKKKKGQPFMNEKERKEVLEALRDVDKVVLTNHKPKTSDMSVSATLAKIKPNVFANGGDRNKKNAADPTSSLYTDIQTCKKIKCAMVFNVGKGGKIQSSSWLLEKYSKAKKKK